MLLKMNPFRDYYALQYILKRVVFLVIEFGEGIQKIN